MPDQKNTEQKPQPSETAPEDSLYEEYLRMVQRPGGDWREGFYDSTANFTSYRSAHNIQPEYERAPPEVIEAMTLRRQQIQDTSQRKNAEDAEREAAELNQRKLSDFSRVRTALYGIVVKPSFPQVNGLDLEDALSTIISATSDRWYAGKPQWMSAKNQETWDKEVAMVPYLIPDSKQVWSIIKALGLDNSYVEALENYSVDAYNWTRTQSGSLGAALLLLTRHQAQNGEIPDWTSWRKLLVASLSDQMVKAPLAYLGERVMRTESGKREALRSFMLGRYWDFLRSELVGSILNEAKSGWLRHPYLELSHGVIGVFQAPLQVVTSVSRRGKLPTLKYQKDIGLSAHKLTQNSSGLPINQWISSLMQESHELSPEGDAQIVNMVASQIRILNTNNPI